jgi:hypothetical protein
MAISLGPKSPLDYSVFSASAGAVLLALHEWHAPGVRREIRWPRRLWHALPRLRREQGVALGIIGLY